MFCWNFEWYPKSNLGPVLERCERKGRIETGQRARAARGGDAATASRPTGQADGQTTDALDDILRAELAE